MQRDYFLTEGYYYEVRQIVENEKPTSIKLYRTNERSVLKFTRLLAGRVSVFLYNEKDNSREDLTHRLGRTRIKLDEHRETSKGNIKFISYENVFNQIKNATVYRDVLNDTLYNDKNGTMYYTEKHGERGFAYLLLREITFISKYENSISKEYKEKLEKKKTISGNEYEKFIGLKYEELGKSVIYNGINKGKKDNGIDLIIHDKEKITFVQCKNWISTNYYNLNSKDIRAFIGDCTMYMINNKINKKYNLHYIVSDENLLSKSAELYIKENNKIKFKIIPYQ